MKRIIGNIMCGVGFFMATMIACTVNVKAYIDPSVTTYLVQAIAGVVVAVGAVAGVYFRKARKNINEKLGIDENRNKEVESDDILVDDDKE